MSKKIIIGGVVLLVAVILIVSIKGGGPDREKVYVEPAGTRTLEALVSAPGEIDPKVKVNISAHIVGKIERLYFVEGDTVKRGQKLVDLERFQYVAQRDRLTAELASRRVEVQRARAALHTAEASYQRAQNLSKQGIQAQELFDQSRLAYENARAGVSAAEQGVQETQAGLQAASTDLERTTIHSPIDGKVVQLNAHEGEVVITGTMNNPGSVIAVIADLSEILVEAEVGEGEVVAVKVGQSAKIKVDAVMDKEYHGHVVEIGSSASQRAGASAVRFFNVKIAIDDSDERLRPGMTSQVSIVTNSAPDAVIVPIQSVVERVPGAKTADEGGDDTPKKKYVFLAKDGKAKQVEVTTGISDATQVQILTGVKKDDPIITGPFRTLKNLKDGAAIEVTKEEKKSTTAKSDEKDKDNKDKK